MGYGNSNESRLDNLEAEIRLRPAMAVLRVEFGGEDAAREAYYRDTPEERLAELVVMVRR